MPNVLVSEKTDLKLMATVWLTRFGTDPVKARDVIEKALGDDDFFTALISAVPGFTSQPNPIYLSRWLSKHENLFFNVDEALYRFAHEGHSWRLRRKDKSAVAA